MTPRDAIRGVAASYREAYAGLPRAAWVISIISLINRAGTMVMVFLPVWLVQVHGMSEAQAISFVSLWGVGALLGVPLGGWLTDRIGGLPVVIASLGGVAISFLLLGAQTDPVGIGVLLFTIGLVGDAFRPAVSALISSACEPAVRSRVFALFRLAVNLGWTLGPILGGLLSEVSWPLLFIVDAATCALAAVLMWRFFRGMSVRAKHVEDEPAAATARGPLRDPLFLSLFACLFLIGCVFMQFLSTFPLYLIEGLGFDKSEAGLIEAINPCFVALFEMVVVLKLQRSNPLRIIAAGAAFIGLGFGLLCVSGSLPWLLLCVLLWSIGEMLEAPLSVAFVANRAPDAARGRYLAIYGTAFSLALVISPLLGGYVRKEYSWTALWVGCGAVGAIAACGLLLVARAVDRETLAG